MKSLFLLASAALISISAFAFSPDVNLDSITPIAGTDHMLIQITSGFGSKFEFKDDDGLATLVSINYMISWERSVALDEDDWEDIKGADAAYYDVARPVLIQQLARLSKNYKEYAKAETDNEAKASFEDHAKIMDAWIKKFTDNKTVSNEAMVEFTNFIDSIAGNHSYQMSVDGAGFEPGNRIFGNGDNEIATHHAGIDSNCRSATNGDLEAIVKGILGGAKPEDVIKSGGAGAK